MVTELIHYLAIGRLDRASPNTHEILSSLLTERGEPLQAICKENAQKILGKAYKLENGKRMRLTSDQGYDIHVMCEHAETATFVFLAVTDQDFGSHHNTGAFSDEFKNVLIRSIPCSEWGASKAKIVKRCDQVLEQVLKKYNTSQLLLANQKVDDVKIVMSENVGMALEHVERIEEMDQKSQQLEKSSKEFHDKSNTVRCRFIEQQWKVLLLLIVVVFVIVVIIVVATTA